MPDVSPVLALPYLMPAQAQKHVTVNEALRTLDLLVQLSVTSAALNAPPATPTEGDRFIVGPSPTGAWAGKARMVADFAAGAWAFQTPLTGWTAYDQATGRFLWHDGATWLSDADRNARFAQLGVSADADATNRLTVSAPGTLLTHAGAGHQVKINKALPADTASLLFQTGFSGRAEMGTTGTDDFAIKVSADGSLFADAISIARASGVASFPQGLSASGFSLRDPADPSKRADFTLSGITTGNTRTYTLPNTSSEIAILAGAQTFSGNKTFSGTLTVSGATATVGTSTATATYGMGTGATASGVTKTVNLGTGGVSGSVTVVNIGSATAGATGTTVVNTPTVTFANTVTQVGMPQANLTAQQLGVGGATADATNRLSVNTPAVLLNNAGAGIEATVNKAAAGNDAAFAFKTGFSTRALIGLLGNDDFSFKVSPDGSAYATGLSIAAATGVVSAPSGMAISGSLSLPAASVPRAALTDGAGLSILGRAADTAGQPADIIAATDNQVLRRSGTSVGFGAVALNQSAAVTGALSPANGGTGVANNAAATLTRTGNHAVTLTTTATTSVTLPAAGTLATLAGTETLTGKTLTAPVINTSVTGTAVTQNTQDGTTGRLLRVADFGVGGTTAPLLANIDSFTIPAGMYLVSNASTTGTLPPVSSVGDGVLVMRPTSNQTTQLYSNPNNGNTFFRKSNSSTSWGPWRRIIDWGNLLGTVSQSGGSPTGAVLESGSNANGFWIRFASGEMICRHTLTLSSGAATTWTFPSAFFDAPVIGGAAIATVLSSVICDSAPTTTGVALSARDKTDARRADSVTVRATGRWSNMV